MDGSTARQLFTRGRVARLATLTPAGRPHLVPAAFTVVDDRVWTAVDDKSKSTRRLQRLANIEANPRVSLLVDRYDDDWTMLWWVRADGGARVVVEPGEGVREALAAKYPQYQSAPLTGPFIEATVDHWAWWSAR